MAPRSDGRTHVPALAIKDVTVRFGGITAVEDLSFSVTGGSIVGIIGPNGAGKTTLFDALSGYVACDGEIRIHGVEIQGMRSDRRMRSGLGRSFQDGRLFGSLIVREAIAVAFETRLPSVGALNAALKIGPSLRSERWIAGQVGELIEMLGLDAYANKFVDELSTGTRRIVDFAAALAHRPRVLLLDEPSSGIAQRETEALGPLLHRVREELECTILLIEHDMPLVTSVSDRLLALESGRLVADGRPAAVLKHPRVVESYLGADPRAVRRSGLVRAK